MKRGVIPFLIATGVAFAHLALMMRAALHHTGGSFAYPLDDPYIHLALAKHIAFDGVYGITRHAFTTAASSIGWPFLLAALMKVFGPAAVLGLAVNAVAAVALVWVISAALAREAPESSVWARTFWTVSVVLLVPLATLVAIGMEHVVHAVLTIAVVMEGARVVTGDEKRSWPLAALGAALVCARYEGLFVVGLLALLLAARRQFARAAAILAASAAPAVVFGGWCLAHGAQFFPTSIVLKRQYFSLTDPADVVDLLGGKFVDALAGERYLLPLVFALLFLLAREVRGGWRFTQDSVRLSVAAGVTFAHVELTSHNWFSRYEAYLVAFDLTVIGIVLLRITPDFAAVGRAFRRSWPAATAGVVAAIAAGAPLASRALEVQGMTPLGCRNVYEQQIQTARFLARYFPSEPVAINDIGAVAFYGDEPIVDLIGLADQRVARAKKFRFDVPLTEAQVGELTAAAPVAVVYDAWVPHPATWVRLAVLRIGSRRSAAWADVSVYATSGESVPRVLQALRDFAPSLPPKVKIEGRFVEPPVAAAGEAYRADGGDVLSFEMKGAPELSAVVVVDPSGSAWLPKIGEVPVRGLDPRAMERATVVEIGHALAEKPDTKIPAGATPSVRLVEPRRPTYIVGGHVGWPGLRELRANETAATALALAVVRDQGGDVDPYVWRETQGTFRKIPFDYDPRQPGAAQAVPLEPGDILIVE